MKLMDFVIAALAVGIFTATHPVTAFADGPTSAYDGEQDLALAPNERVVSESLTNDDGAVEDPNAPMSGTARAFRNGLLNGRAMQKQLDAQQARESVPPLPKSFPDERIGPMPKGYDGYPKAAMVQAIPQPAPRYQPYQPAPQPEYRRPQPPVVVNVVQPDPRYYERAEEYGRAPSWRNRQEAMQEYGYDPYPPPGYQPPQPVYVQQQPVYVQPAPVIVQHYVPRAMPAYPYAGGYISYRGRGWGGRIGW